MKKAFKGSDYNYRAYKKGRTIKNNAADWSTKLIAALVVIVVFGGVLWLYLSYRNYRKYYPTIRQLEKRHITSITGEYQLVTYITCTCC